VSVTVELRGAGDARFRAIVSEGYAGLVGALREVDRTLPWFVEREFRAYLGW